jgi:hypothetical protein
MTESTSTIERQTTRCERFMFLSNGKGSFPCRYETYQRLQTVTAYHTNFIQSVPPLDRLGWREWKTPRRTVILGHHRLLGHRTQLNLDVHHPQVLARHVHLDEPRIDRLVKLAEPGDETDGSLWDGFVRVGELEVLSERSWSWTKMKTMTSSKHEHMLG